MTLELENGYGLMDGSADYVCSLHRASCNISGMECDANSSSFHSAHNKKYSFLHFTTDIIFMFSIWYVPINMTLSFVRSATMHSHPFWMSNWQWWMKFVGYLSPRWMSMCERVDAIQSAFCDPTFINNTNVTGVDFNDDFSRLDERDPMANTSCNYYRMMKIRST